MNMKLIIKDYPCLDIDKLSYEVENEKYYLNIVTFFHDALRENLFYGKTLTDINIKNKFEKFEIQYIKYFKELSSKFKLYKYLNSNIELIDDFTSFIPEVRCAIREDNNFMDMLILIPEEKILIVFGHDLKLIHFYPKSNNFSSIILNLLKKYKIDYE